MFYFSRPFNVADDPLSKHHPQNCPANHIGPIAFLENLVCKMEDGYSSCTGNDDDWMWVKEMYNQTFPEEQQQHAGKIIPDIMVNFEFLNPSKHNIDHGDHLDLLRNSEIKKTRSRYPCADFPSYKVRSWAKGFFVALKHNLSTKHGVWRAKSNMDGSFYAFEDHASRCDACADPVSTIRQGRRMCRYGLMLAEKVVRAVDEWAKLCTPKEKGRWAFAFVDVPAGYQSVKRLLKAVEKGEMTEMFRSRRSTAGGVPLIMTPQRRPTTHLEKDMGRKVKSPVTGSKLSVPEVSHIDHESSNCESGEPSSWGRARIRRIVGQEARVIQSLDFYSRAIFNKLRLHVHNGRGSRRFNDFVSDLGNPTEIIFSALEVLIDVLSDGNRPPCTIRKVYYLLHLAMAMQQSSYISKSAKGDLIQDIKAEFPLWRESLQLEDDRQLFGEIFAALWEEDTSSQMELSSSSPPSSKVDLSRKKVMMTMNTFLASNRSVALTFMDFLGDRNDDYYSREQRWEMSHLREMSQRVAYQSHTNFVQQVENLVISRLLSDDTRPFHWFVKQVQDQLNSGWIGTVHCLETMLVSFARIPDCTVEEYFWFCAAVFRLCSQLSKKVEPYRCYIQKPSLSYGDHYLDRRTTDEKLWFPESPTQVDDNDDDEDTDMLLDDHHRHHLHHHHLHRRFNFSGGQHQDPISVSLSVHGESLYPTDISPSQLHLEDGFSHHHHAAAAYNRIRSYSDINPRSAPRFSIDVEDVDLNQDISPSDAESYIGGSIMNQLIIPIMTDYDFDSASAASPTRLSPWTSPSPRATHTQSPLPPDLTDAFANSSLTSPTRPAHFGYDSLRTPSLDVPPAFLDPWASLNSPVAGLGGFLPTTLSTRIPSIPVTTPELTGSPYLESPFSLAPDASLFAHSPVLPTPTSATSTHLPSSLPQPMRKRRRQRSDPTPNKTTKEEEEPAPKKAKGDSNGHNRRKSSTTEGSGRRPSQKTYDCDLCGARINGPKMNFDRHVISIHGPNRRIKCPWPGCDVSMKAARSDNMRTHMKRHESREKGGLPQKK